jgi:hypothetical protein
MPVSKAADPGDRIQLRQILTWGALLVLLVLGVVLWFRFAGRVMPMLDALSGR